MANGKKVAAKKAAPTPAAAKKTSPTPAKQKKAVVVTGTSPARKRSRTEVSVGRHVADGSVDPDLPVTPDGVVATGSSIVQAINELRASIAALDQKVAALDQKVTASIVALDQKVTASIVALDQKVTASIAGSPQQAVSYVPREHFPPLSGDDAQSDGDISTWTRCQQGGKVYAVGCAHCAFYYRTMSGLQSFVSVPHQILGTAVRVLFSAVLLEQTQMHSPTAMDFVAVELNVPFDATLPEWPVNGAAFPTPDAVTGAVAGRANSCYVLGENLFQFGQKSAHPGCFGFVEQQGEAGNSGTLMYAFTKDLTPVPLGVYCGTASTGANMRHRGRVCPLPSLASLRSVDVVALMNASMVMMDKNGQRTCAFDNGYLTDGVKYPGVLIQEKVAYMGSQWVGSCRAR